MGAPLGLHLLLVGRVVGREWRDDRSGRVLHLVRHERDRGGRRYAPHRISLRDQHPVPADQARCGTAGNRHLWQREGACRRFERHVRGRPSATDELRGRRAGDLSRGRDAVRFNDIRRTQRHELRGGVARCGWKDAREGRSALDASEAFCLGRRHQRTSRSRFRHVAERRRQRLRRVHALGVGGGIRRADERLRILLCVGGRPWCEEPYGELSGSLHFRRGECKFNRAERCPDA